jgi:hypothetical protein
MAVELAANRKRIPGIQAASLTELKPPGTGSSVQPVYLRRAVEILRLNHVCRTDIILRSCAR